MLYLIDGSSQMYRAYHAIRELTGPDGRSTNAVYGFVTMLRKLVNDQHPPFIAASFDLAGPTFRSALAADYKANRAPMPADLAEQIPWVHAACEAMGVPIITAAGFEADDVIGTIATRAAAAAYDVIIVTGDKDLLQLVHGEEAGAEARGGAVRVFNPRDEGFWYDSAAVIERFGVTPDRVVDVLALTGDSIDNIKGVTGIGDKGARDLITTYGSLEELLAHAAEVPQKKYREALLAQVEDARQSRELARIRTDVPLEFDLGAFRYQGPSRQRCYELFSQLGFRSLLMEFAPTAGDITKDYALVETIEDLDALAADLRRAGRFAFRVLQSEPAAMRADIVGIAFSTTARRARYVPVGHRLVGMLGSDSAISRGEALDRLGPLFEDPAVSKIGHDLKIDLVLLEQFGVRVQGLECDTMLASCRPKRSSTTRANARISPCSWPTGSARSSPRRASIVSTARWRCRWCRCSSKSSAPASASTAPRSPGCRPGSRASSRREPSRSIAPRARRSTSTRRGSSPRYCSRS